jgi:phosphatidylinositol alpha-1,6-mannosyltransferase
MQTHADYLSRYLAARGHEIRVVTYQTTDAAEREECARFDASLKFSVERRLSRLGYCNNLSLLSQMAREFAPDLIYCSTVFYGLLEQRTGAPVICRCVGNDVLRPWIAWPFEFLSGVLSARWVESFVMRRYRRCHSPEWLSAFFRKRRRGLMERSVLQVRMVLANSRFTDDLLAGIGVPDARRRILVGGVDSERFASATPLRRAGGRYVLMTACRLVPKKGIEFLLRAMVRLREWMPDVFLVIVGDGPHLSRLERLAERLGLLSHVQFAGRVPHREIAAYYASADQFILASRESVAAISGERDVETMGRVLCEANAARVPVVASRSGGIPSVIEHEANGLLFEPEDEAGLLDCVRRLRTDDALRQSLVTEGSSRAHHKFDWPVILRAHEDAFNTLIDCADTLP